MSAATAGMPLPLLLDKLERQGWSGLERRHAVVLRSLCARLPHRSAEGTATVEQLATCYSTRWTRETLAELEDLAVVEWHRGGVRAGKPHPSTFRVVKARLVELLVDGAVEFAQLVARRKAATAARIAGLSTSFPRRTSSHRRGGLAGVDVAGLVDSLRRSAHAEVRSDPTLRREGTDGATAPSPVPFGTGTPSPTVKSELTALRARLFGR